MKIGIIGNMNNMYFSLARYLKDLGYDCTLLIFNNEPLHFHPSCDTFNDNYLSYCRQLTWGDPAGFLRQDLRQIEKDLAPFHFLIGSGPAPAFVARIGRKLDIFIPYGEDFYSLPFYKIVHPVRIPAYFATANYQLRGIRESPYVLLDKTNKNFENSFSRLKYQGKRIMCSPPLLYHKEYNNEEMEINKDTHPFAAQLQKIRKENDIVILQHVQQLWKKASGKLVNNKGNDRLIHGFKDFIRQYPKTKIKLLLIEYGKDVPNTKRLISSLHLGDHIHWFPKLPRKYIMHFINQSDLIVGELYHSWFSYCVVSEALCMGKPIMHKRNDDEYINNYSSLYPMIYADSAACVTKGLVQLINKREDVERIGNEGRDWFFKNCIKKPLNEIVSIIKRKRSEVLAS